MFVNYHFFFFNNIKLFLFADERSRELHEANESKEQLQDLLSSKDAEVSPIFSLFKNSLIIIHLYKRTIFTMT